MIKFIGLFLVTFISIAANLPDNVITRFGVDANYLIAALAAIVVAWLAAHRNTFFVILICLLAVAANVSEEVAAKIGYDRDIILATLVAVLLLPYIKRLLDWD